jgi:hypothetical protein
MLPALGWVERKPGRLRHSSLGYDGWKGRTSRRVGEKCGLVSCPGNRLSHRGCKARGGRISPLIFNRRVPPGAGHRFPNADVFPGRDTRSGVARHSSTAMLHRSRRGRVRSRLRAILDAATGPITYHHLRPITLRRASGQARTSTMTSTCTCELRSSHSCRSVSSRVRQAGYAGQARHPETMKMRTPDSSLRGGRRSTKQSRPPVEIASQSLC